MLHAIIVKPLASS